MVHLKGTTVTWLGHSAVLVETRAGTKILIDPFLKHNPKFPKHFKLPERLDLILATHGHYDHIGDVIPLAEKTSAPVVAMFELAMWFQGNGVEKIVPLGYGGSYTHNDVIVTMTQARHSSGIQDGEKIIYGGEPAGYVLQIEDGPTLYHAGDTDVFSDMKLIAELHEPTFGMLPIGGTYTMDPRGAAIATRFLGLKAVLPLHWGTMPELTGTPEELEEYLGNVGIQVVRTAPGETIR